MDEFANPRISKDDSRETDENIQMFQKNQILKKPQMKHFMSPTISATSKATVPRHKILTERNEFSDSSETHQQKTPHLILKNSKTFSRKTASGTRVYHSDEDEHNDSSSKPYDPLTNYLSPRPKFLRYNPNRRREVYNRLEIEVLEGSDGRSSSLSSSPKSSDDLENEEVDIVNKDDDHSLEDDDEKDNENNEGGSSWIGLFKFILVSVVLLLLTWYISCMNLSEPLPTIHLGENGYIAGYNSTFSIVDVSNTGKQKERNEFSDNGDDQLLRLEMDRHDQTWEIGITESSEKTISFQDDQVPSASDLVSDYVFENGDEYKRSEAGLEGADSGKGIEFAETGDKFKYSDSVETYFSENEESGSLVSLDSEIETATIGEISAEGDGKVEENDTGSDNSAEIGFSCTNDTNYGAFIGLFVIIASSLIGLIGFYLKCKRTPIDKSRSVDKPLYNTIISTENICSEIQFLPNYEETHVEKVDSYVNTSTYFRSVEENAKDFPLTRAPTVELLGEFVVGEGRSKMKSCNLKSSSRETELKPKEIESQGDTNYVFLDNVVNSRGILSTSELSASTTMDSPLYGSVTDKKKVIRKEINSRGILSTPELSASTTMDSPLYGSVTDKKVIRKEEGSMTNTPVRRSSRIRNRVMSP